MRCDVTNALIYPAKIPFAQIIFSCWIVVHWTIISIHGGCRIISLTGAARSQGAVKKVLAPVDMSCPLRSPRLIFCADF
jgi:hypothetical protein